MHKKQAKFEDVTENKTVDSEFVPFPPRRRTLKPRNVFNKDTDYFRKAELMPSLFNLEIDKKLYQHLNDDDLDEVSKNEVVYKVLKEHLRQH